MADLRIVDAPVLLQESITDDVKMPTGGLGNFSIRLGDIVWYVVTKEQLANKNYVDLSSKGVKDKLDSHIADKANPHQVTKEQVGLSNVDNTADIDKPVSNATKSAIITATKDVAALYGKNVEAGAGVNGWDASLVLDKSGATQQQVNYNGGSKWHSRVGGYFKNERAVLANGDIVKSTVDGNENDPNVNMTGWISIVSDSLVRSKTELESINAKHGDIVELISMNNSEIIGGGSFIYDETKSHINDGGVIIKGWCRRNISSINLSMYGLKGDGSETVDVTLKNALQTSALLSVPFKNNQGVFLLSGASDIKISFEADFSGTLFKLTNSWRGRVSIDRNETVSYIYAGDNLLTSMQNDGIIKKGQVEIASLASNDILNDSYAVFYSNQPFYSYRNEIKMREDYHRVLNRGQLESPFLFDLDANKITKIKYIKRAKTILTVKGLSFDETDINVDVSTQITILTIVNSTRVHLIDTSFYGGSSTDKTSTIVRLSTSFSHELKIDGIYSDSAYLKVPTEYSYTIALNGGINIDILNADSDGKGWGATGNNSCSRVTFDNCKLNRIDFHNPCYQFLKVKNSTIGDWGVLATIVGDIYIQDCIYNFRTWKTESNIYSSRPDMGGIATGKLVIDNIYVNGIRVSNAYSILKNAYSPGSNDIPTGSPIPKTFFEEINISNLYDDDGVFERLIWSADKNQLTLPKRLKFDNINLKYNNCAHLFTNVFAERPDIVEVIFSNCRLDYISIISQLNPSLNVTTHNTTPFRLFVDKCVPYNAEGVHFQITSNVKSICISDSIVKKYREYSGNQSIFANNTFVSFSNCFIENKDIGNDFQLINAHQSTNPASRIKFSNCDFKVTDSSLIHWFMSKMQTSNCTYNAKQYIPLFNESAKTSHSITYNISDTCITYIVKHGSQMKVEQIKVYIGENNSATYGGLTVGVSVASNVTTVTFTSTEVNGIKLIGAY